ncbi:unnamed protein product [Brassica rapa subsp. narinosa]
MFKILNRNYRGRLVFIEKEISPKIVGQVNQSGESNGLLRNLQFDTVQWQKDHSQCLNGNRSLRIYRRSSIYQTPKTLFRGSSSDGEHNNNLSVSKSGYSAEPNSHLDKSVLCRISVRLPDGRRVQRSFLKSESVQLLWSFCYSQIDQSERNKPFKLFQAIPGYYKNLSYGSYTSFEQSGLASSLVSVTWM